MASTEKLLKRVDEHYQQREKEIQAHIDKLEKIKAEAPEGYDATVLTGVIDRTKEMLLCQ